MRIHHIDHVGIIVNDLPAARAFFLDFGLELQGEGAALDQVVGLSDVKTSFAFLRAPDGQATIELIKYHTPSDENGIQHPMANTLGIRHVAFVVEDIEAVVAKLKEKGTESFSAIQYKTLTARVGSATCAGRRGSFSSWQRKYPNARLVAPHAAEACLEKRGAWSKSLAPTWHTPAACATIATHQWKPPNTLLPVRYPALGNEKEM